MFGGPVMYLGLCLVGWVMVWNRPHYAFAAVYALCLFTLIVGLAAFEGGLAPLLEVLRGRALTEQLQILLEFVAVIAAIPIGFVLIGSGIVALRKWMVVQRAS